MTEEPDVWLFPNFGKKDGFGEPDAVVLAGGHSFWYEVETNFDLIKKKSKARNSIRQLLRFYYLNRILATGKTTRNIGKDHWAWMGYTIRDSGELKFGKLRAARHGVLSRFEKRFQDAARNNRDHYVILSDRKMKGISKKQGRRTALHSLFMDIADQSHQHFENATDIENILRTPTKPCSTRFWYQYYEGDLSSKGVNIEQDALKYTRVSSG